MQTQLSVSVSVTEAALLTGKSERWIRKLTQETAMPVEIVNSVVGGGNAGLAYRIPLEALPADAQLKYYAKEAAQGGLADGTADILAYRERYGDDGLRELLERQQAVMTIKGIRAAGGVKVRSQIEALAEKLNVSARTMQKLTDRVNDMVRDIPRQYVAKEDWMINNQSIDRKLDRIMEILMKGAGGTTNG